MLAGYTKGEYIQMIVFVVCDYLWDPEKIEREQRNIRTYACEHAC